MTIDTTKPLEVINDATGERVAVWYERRDEDGDIVIGGHNRFVYKPDGRHWLGSIPYRLQNVPEPQAEPIDWSGELELSDGTRVVSATHYGGPNFYMVKIEGFTTTRDFRADGTPKYADACVRSSWPVNGRTVRNRKADGIDVKQERLAFETWWRSWCPDRIVPEVTSHIFDAWLASARRSTQLRTRIAELEKANEFYAGQYIDRVAQLNIANAELTELRAWKAAAVEKHSEAGEWRPIEQNTQLKGLRRDPKYYPAIGETCRESGPNCDDADGYTWGEVEVLWRDDLFIVTHTPGCWPTVTKLELALFEPLAPVDADLLEARRLCAAQPGLSAPQSHAFRDGNWDAGGQVDLALAALRRGRELERERG